MDYTVVKGVTRGGSTLEWINVKTLGEGSYGVVHLVKPIKPDLDPIFAVKSCLYQDSLSLQKEQRILRRLVGCPYIVQCFGDTLSIDEEGEVVYNLFLEYAPRGDLFDLITKRYWGKIPECNARFYARMLVLGLRNIHERGYVHCDLKPENILVFPFDLNGLINGLKIADFGLAKQPGERVDGPPGKVNFPGTAVNMPPESVENVKISASLDIWSLGCVVLQMITGEPPWEYENLTDLAIKLFHSRNPPKIPENMSSAGKDFLMKCFARNPSERWTAAMLLNHPYLLPDLPSQTNFLHRAQAGSHLPSMKHQTMQLN
ncbi:Mitogen-activated protein kinase kinase kinase 21, putative [Theobroma cacao]|uniref:Mitogen-activated protein kinase kinase kinase 21, putative n=1 Tax=Theobroma cacao TaxID=3641 RepID=A0A061FK70_THECC|nr:Mitogen-activated protein kinase kinase kinase 21, putative [Theobroma cacao]